MRIPRAGLGPRLAVVAILVLAATALQAQFPPVVPGVQNRPSLLLETQFYVFGPAVELDTPELTLTKLDNGYGQPVTVYLYWENRDNGSRRYFNDALGFGGAEVDVFGVPGNPDAVPLGQVNSRLGCQGNVCDLFGPGATFGELPGSIPRTVGLYQFVVEYRDAAGAGVISRSNAMYSYVANVVFRNGTITENQRWTANNAYYLDGPTFIDGGSTLTIEPGTVVYGGNFRQGVLVIKPGSKIMARGTADKPIVLTSEFDVGEREVGDWGGLVISGNAPCNACPREGEGDSGLFGGNNPNDSSGVLAYVRVEFAGIRFTDQNELNGIAFQGVGRGTEVHHIQVAHNADDGVEFFGGTVDAKYVLVTDCQDDSVDWTFGFTGRLQHVVVLQRFDDHDKGIEADNNSTNPGLLPRSNPHIRNGTFWVRKESGDEALLFRVGSAVTARNLIVGNSGAWGVEVDGPDSEALIGGLLTVDSSIFWDNDDGLSNVPLLGADNRVVNPLLPHPLNRVQPDIAPAPGSPALTGAEAPNDPFFDNVPYFGGVDPLDPWIDDGWTTFADD